MRLKVINYSDHDLVTTPLVLLQAVLENSDSSCCSSQSEVLTLESNVLNSHDVPREWKRTSVRKFKNGISILFELALGENEIHLKTRHVFKNSSCSDMMKNVVTIIHLRYEESVNINIIQPIFVYCSEDKETLFPGEKLELLDSVTSSVLNRKFPQIPLALKLIQTFFSEQLQANGYGRKSFTCKYSESAFIPFELKTKKEDLLNMDTHEVWTMLGKGIIKGYPLKYNETTKYLAFMLNDWKNMSKSIGSNSTFGLIASSSAACSLAAGAGALAMIPSSFTSTWPVSLDDIFSRFDDNREFKDQNFIPGCSTIARAYSASMGCLAHELGHVFDLGHTINGLMGADFYAFNSFMCPPATFKKVLERHGLNYYSPINFYISNKGGVTEEAAAATLDKSSALLLYNHKWFQSGKSSIGGLQTDIRIRIIRNKIESSAGIAVVQLRDMLDGNVLSSWIYGPDSGINKFSLSRQDIPADYIWSQNSVLLFAEDNSGNILQNEVKIDSLPSSSFTKLNSLGALFTPIKNDVHVQGNVNKLITKHSTNPEKFNTFHGMIEAEINSKESFTIESLLLLKLGLHFTYFLLLSIIEDFQTNVTFDSLSNNYIYAYENSLNIHHNWMVKKFFTMCIKSRICPKRRDLLKSFSTDELSDEAETVQELNIFVDGLVVHLQSIFDLYILYGLDSSEHIR